MEQLKKDRNPKAAVEFSSMQVYIGEPSWRLLSVSLMTVETLFLF